MSFRDLVTGKASDLTLPVDLSPTLQTAGGVAAAAAISVATAAAALFIPGGIGGGNIGRGASAAYRQYKEGAQRREEAIATNEQNRLLRIQLGITYLERIAATCGNLSEISFKLGQAEYYLKHPKHALKRFQEAVDLDPKNIPAYLRASLIYSELGQESEAIAILEKAKSFGETNPETNWLLAGIYESRGDAIRANECWISATVGNPAFYEPWLKQAQYHADHRNYAQARRCFETARKLNASTKLPWEELVKKGNEALQAGRLDEANEDFKQASHFISDLVSVYIGMAKCAMHARRNSEAAQLLEKAVSVTPVESSTYLLAAENARALGDAALGHKFWMLAFG